MNWQYDKFRVDKLSRMGNLKNIAWINFREYRLKGKNFIFLIIIKLLIYTFDTDEKD